MYQYTDRKQKKFTIDLLVSTLEDDNYEVRFNEDGTEILVFMTMQ